METKSRHQVFDPALQAGPGVFAGIGGVAGGERLEDVKDAPVAPGPGCEGGQGEEEADERDAKVREPSHPCDRKKSQGWGTEILVGDGAGAVSLMGHGALVPGRPRTHRGEGGGKAIPDQGAIGAQERGVGHREREDQGASPAGPILEAGGGPGRESQAEQGERLGERLRVVDGGKGAERGQPERGLRGGRLVTRRGTMR